MTTLLKSMIAHYKETGSRVDEVLFQEVMKVVDQVPELRKTSMAWEDTARNYFDEILRLREEIKLKDKVLSFYAAEPTYDIRPDGKGGMHVDIEEDKGYRARMHLRRGSHASGKGKDITGNR